MNLQGRDLKLELRGNDVGSLHSDLAKLGLAIPDNERQGATFGPGTRDVVTNFQKEHGLPTTGAVDAATASLITQAVDRITYTVAGTVTSPDRAGVGGLRVQIVDKNVG